MNELCNERADGQEDLPVSSEIVEALNRRMEHFRQQPDAFTTWEAAKERILRGKR